MGKTPTINWGLALNEYDGTVLYSDAPANIAYLIRYSLGL
jgi:hypothetical protein